MNENTVSEPGQRSSPEATDEDPPEPEGVTVVVPAFEEEGAVGRTVDTVKRALEDSPRPFEVLVVDDGSRDRTAERARRVGARVLRHDGNRGYGAALKTGIRHARWGLLCITDADGTYPNERIPELVERLAEGDADMVVGARTGEEVTIPLLRRPVKWMLRGLAELVVGHSIPDLNSGLRVFRQSTVRTFLDLLPEGFSFTTTLTLGMLSNGYLVEYVSIDYHSRVGRSKIRPVRDLLNFLTLVLRVGLYFAPLKIFLPLSASLALIAVAWGVVSKVVVGQLADVSTVVVFMTAILVAVMGMLAELIDRRMPNPFRKDS